MYALCVCMLCYVWMQVHYVCMYVMCICGVCMYVCMVLVCKLCTYVMCLCYVGCYSYVRMDALYLCTYARYVEYVCNAMYDC